jgi:DNA-binding transcriptional ArsR family regulator
MQCGLRLLSDGYRAALLRIVDDLPAVVGECIPECADDPATAALSIQLIRALYEGSPLTVEAITARSFLPPEVVRSKLERLEASGLVQLSPKSNRHDTRWVLPTATLRACGDDVLDRFYYALTRALNRP